MTTKPRVTAPSDLKGRGKALWRSIIERYTLDPAETALLLELCRTTDELDVLTAMMATQSPMVVGSQGQPRPNPLLGEIRAHRRVAEKLVVGLALPAEGQTVGQRRSLNAAAAANARWRHGKGA
jgi:hypothetical protein